VDLALVITPEGPFKTLKRGIHSDIYIRSHRSYIDFAAWTPLYMTEG
jgi:hypothetical protein